MGKREDVRTLRKWWHVDARLSTSGTEVQERKTWSTSSFGISSNCIVSIEIFYIELMFLFSFIIIFLFAPFEYWNYLYVMQRFDSLTIFSHSWMFSRHSAGV